MLTLFGLLFQENLKELFRNWGWNSILISYWQIWRPKLYWVNLRGLWWFWSIFGLSAGLALAPWLYPFLEDIYPTIHLGHQPPAAASPFTPAWLTLDRRNTFKSGMLSIINAAGNLPPTKIETVAEPQTESFARALVDMFILSGSQPKDFGQGDYVGTPTTHRLATGITIVAPVPSLAAEALRVGFERVGIQTRRSTDHSRSDDYLVVEVGPAP